MTRVVLLLGKKGIVVDKVAEQLDVSGIQLLGGTCIDDVKEVFSKESIDTVIMGAGIDLQDRLEIIQKIFQLSNKTTVHMKDFDSGPEGMIPFVNAVLKGLEGFDT